MNNTRDPEWLKHVFRYQRQLRADGRVLGANDLEVLKVVAVLALSAQRPSTTRIAAESSTFLTDHTVRKCLDRLSTLGVLHAVGTGWTTGAPPTWQGYNAHAADPVGVDRQIEGFLRDLETRIADLLRRQPKKRLVG